GDDKPLICLSFFYRIQVFPLEVLNESDFQGIVVAGFPNDGGNPKQAGALCGPPTAFPRDQLEKPIAEHTNDNGVDESRVLYRVGPLIEASFVEALPWLV